MLSKKYVAPSETKMKAALIDARTNQERCPYDIPAFCDAITIKPIIPNQGVKNTMVFHFTTETAKS